MSRAEVDPKQGLQGRRERVLSYTLVEILIALVFIASAYGVLAANEGNQKIETQRVEVATLKLQLSEALKERDALKVERDRLDRWIRRLWQVLRPDVTYPVEPNEIDELIGQLEGKSDQIRMAFGQAPGLPVCKVGPASLLSITPLDNGDLAARLGRGDTSSMAEAGRIDGVTEVDGRAFSLEEFRMAAARIADWGKNQSQPCRFRVEVARAEHNKNDLYLTQLAPVEEFFYARKLR